MSSATSAASNYPPPQPFTLQIWLILIISSIGFAFDIYELLMLPLVLRDAIQQLAGAAPGSPTFQFWAGLLFYVPALLGGVFGLVGGYLTDWLGRRRVLTWSILLYAASAFCAGFSTNMIMLLVLRTTTFIGVCVEFVAAVAWLAELFPNPHQRESVLGYTQAFSSIGGLLVAIANNAAILLVKKGTLMAVALPTWLSFLGEIDPAKDSAWRYTLMSGLIPAIPLILVRPFLPESPAWARKKREGTLKRPSILELFAPQYIGTTIVTTILFACSYGAAFGAIQQIPQIVPGLAEVRQEVAEKTEKQRDELKELTAKAGATPSESAEKAIAAKKAEIGRIKGGYERTIGSEYTKMQEIGGLIGRFLLAFLAVRIVSRKLLLRLFQVPALLLLPLVFYYFLTLENQTFYVLDLEFLLLGKFPVTTVSLLVLLCGLFVVGQFSFWGNYLPLVYPIHLRGTGESFAANIGGRMIGTSFAYLSTTLATVSDPALAPVTMSHVAAGVALGVTLVGLITSFFLPERRESIAD